MIISNIVEKEKMRKVQSEVLELIAKSLLNSFGPNASNTKIVKALGENNSHVHSFYSKDGHTILCNLGLTDFLEESIRHDLEELTRHIVNTVGDGTTSAVLLSKIIFDKFIELEKDTDMMPYDIIRTFQAAVKDIKDKVYEAAQEFNSEKAYDIALISTNNNKEVSTNIKNIYKEYGNDVYINVVPSTGEESYLKIYDGMTLNNGFSDVAYINNTEKATCTLAKPRIYIFEDPIDTREMAGLFSAIINSNITAPAADKTGQKMVYPTVILAPKITRDMSAFLDEIVAWLYQIKDVRKKPPILVITDVYQQEQLSDIGRLCGCKTIKKYLNLEVQQKDIEEGKAPTIDTVAENFYGTADLVEADNNKTKFINPEHMYDKDGKETLEFTQIVNFLESELKKAIKEGENDNVVGNIRRRLHSLKGQLVEYGVGGISIADRDSLKDLVEDAVLNCKSASIHGVGFGANYEGLLASLSLKDNSRIHNIIYEAYKELSVILYQTCFKKKEDALFKVEESIRYQAPYNLRTEVFDGVFSSIDSDPVILDTISKIISLMFTCNQFLYPAGTVNNHIN